MENLWYGVETKIVTSSTSHYVCGSSYVFKKDVMRKVTSLPPIKILLQSRMQFVFLKLVSSADCPLSGRAAIKIITSVPVLETIFSIFAKCLNDTVQISRSLCLYFQLFKLEIFNITIQYFYLSQIILFTCHGLLCTPSLQPTYSYKLLVK